MKRCAVSCVLAFFQLADLEPDKVKARVEELLKDHRYIFAINPVTVSLRQRVHFILILSPSQKQLQLDKPFCHGSLRFVLKEELFSKASFVTQNIDRFPATNPTEPTMRELPDPMVALAGTAVRCVRIQSPEQCSRSRLSRSTLRLSNTA